MMNEYVFSCYERGIYGKATGNRFELSETELTIILDGEIVVHVFGECECYRFDADMLL